MPYYAYILQSLRDNSYYIGQTADIEKRILMHNQGRCKSTKGRVPWRLIYYETFASRKKAIRREKEIKSRKKRFYIESLILE
jgi:putative endonuclease